MTRYSQIDKNADESDGCPRRNIQPLFRSDSHWNALSIGRNVGCLAEARVTCQMVGCRLQQRGCCAPLSQVVQEMPARNGMYVCIYSMYMHTWLLLADNFPAMSHLFRHNRQVSQQDQVVMQVTFICFSGECSAQSCSFSSVMGPTGAGKSTVSSPPLNFFSSILMTTSPKFIERATSRSEQTVGHDLCSLTADIRTARIPHPIDGHPVLFVDTPGFDDTFKSDVEIVDLIAKFLVRTCVCLIERLASMLIFIKKLSKESQYRIHTLLPQDLR